MLCVINKIRDHANLAKETAVCGVSSISFSELIDSALVVTFRTFFVSLPTHHQQFNQSHLMSIPSHHFLVQIFSSSHRSQKLVGWLVVSGSVG